nr:FAD-dependent monooxygenase [Parvularcula dongshanensis]
MTRGPAPRFTGQVAWRAVVPAHALAAGTIPPDATSWTGPGRHLVTYYLRGGAFINVVAVEERAGFAAEDWRQAGDPAALKAAFAGWDPRLLALLDAVETPFLWGLFDHPPLASWTDGAVALLGDAAHPMLPFLAQGAAMALEDAWVLAAMLSGADDVPSALRRYGAIRRPRTTRVQRMSAANRAIFHAGKGPAHLPARLARGAARLAPGLAGRRLAAVYGHDVTD